jgi:hypothetical protein
MTWPWLTETAVLLFMFIMNVLNVPQTLAANWQFVKSAVRWVRRPKSPAPSAVVAAPKDEAIARTPAPPPSYILPPRFIMRPGYRYNGGAVPTSAVIDLDGYRNYMDLMTTLPTPQLAVPVRVLRDRSRNHRYRVGSLGPPALGV